MVPATAALLAVGLARPGWPTLRRRDRHVVRVAPLGPGAVETDVRVSDQRQREASSAAVTPEPQLVMIGRSRSPRRA
jgi:hypothetical protein